MTVDQTTAIQKGFTDAGLAPQAGGWATPWERQDAIWYERIAVQGYAPDGTTAYFPLLPLLMRVAQPLTGGNIAWAGLLVAALAAIAAFALLYRLATRDTDPLTAGRTVAYLALFPTAFFLLSAYTESLFLALTLGAFWAARQRRWPLVILCAALAGLTRVQGALLGLPLAIEYLAATGWRWRPFALGALPAQVRAWLAQRPLPSGKEDRVRGENPPMAGSLSPPSAHGKGAGGLGRAGAGGVGRLLTLAAIAGAGGAGTLAFFAYRSYVVQDPLSWTARESWALAATHHLAGRDALDRGADGLRRACAHH